MYELFAPNLVNSAPIKKYQAGDIFSLSQNVALVMSGVIAVDAIPDDEDRPPLTIRLAGEGDVINLEALLSKDPPAMQYVCESKEAVLAVISMSYFTDALASRSVEVQNSISQALLKAVSKHYTAVIDTLLNVASNPVEGGLMWAIGRYQTTSKLGGDLGVRKERLATHLGVRPETVSRVLSKMEMKGKIRKSRSSLRIEASDDE